MMFTIAGRADGGVDIADQAGKRGDTRHVVAALREVSGNVDDGRFTEQHHQGMHVDALDSICGPTPSRL